MQLTSKNNSLCTQFLSELWSEALNNPIEIRNISTKNLQWEKIYIRVDF